MSYEVAVRMKDVRRFRGWREAEGLARVRSDDDVVFLRDDLVVLDDPFAKRPLFSDLTLDWYRYCVGELGLSRPAYRPHPMNTQFSWTPGNRSLRLLTKEQMRSYDEIGYTVVPGAFTREEIERVRREIDRLEEAVERSLKRLKPGEAFIARSGEFTVSSHLVKRSRIVKEFVRSRVIQDIAADLVGPDVRLYWDQAVYKKPGARDPFPWHQDNGYTFVEPQQYPTVWIALTDADEENGCVWIVPHAHRLGTIEHRRTSLGYVCIDETPPDAIPIPAKAGDVVLFSSLTPHATGPNRTTETRKAYILQLVPDGAYSRTIDESGVEGRVLANVADRQFFVLRDGRGVSGD